MLNIRLLRFSFLKLYNALITGGIYPPITTPFNHNESIAWDKLQANLEQFNRTGLRGYLVQGSNGEYCYMTSQERIEMIKKVKYYFCQFIKSFDFRGGKQGKFT